MKTMFKDIKIIALLVIMLSFITILILTREDKNIANSVSVPDLTDMTDDTADDTINITDVTDAPEITEHAVMTDIAVPADYPVIEYEEIGDNELRGVWIATVLNINFPSKPGISAEQMKAELDDIIKTCKETNLNAIFFQVRPTSDALYKSEIFPASKYLAGKQGDSLPGGFDPLAYIIQAAHQNNIELHAWINPYRITNGGVSNPEQDLNALAENNPARKNPQWVVKYPDGKLYYNPGLPEVQKLITDGVLEIIKNYDIDGIHFDDYFYPYPVSGAKFDDGEAFAKYGGDYDTIENFRRGSVNKLIQGVYNEIKNFDPNIRFGVSPFGIWANKSSRPDGSDTAAFESYSSLYSDAKAWAEGGYVDYICPQIYWSFGTENAPFDVLTRWWSTLLDGTGVDLYVGHAVFKVNDWKSELEIPRQVEYARNYISVKGSVFYGYADLKANSQKVRDNLKELFAEPRKVLRTASDINEIIIGRPLNNAWFTEKTVNLMGGSNPAFPVYHNDKKVTRTKSGFFSVFVELKSGTNNIVLTQNGSSITHMINQGSKPYVYPQTDSYKLEVIYPKSDVMTEPGDKITVRVQAPSNSTVTAELNGTAVNLTPLTIPPDEGKYMTEVYSGTLVLPNTQPNGQTIDLGNIIFKAVRNSETASVTGINVKLANESTYIGCEVKKDYAHIKIAPDSSFYDDYLPASAGMRDNIAGLKDGYYKLSFGGYVAVDDVVKITNPVPANRILSAVMENKGRVTELRFKVTENAPVNAKCKDGVFNVTLYNTNEAQNLSLVNNPLFEKAALTQNKENKSATYSFNLIRPDNFYGFEVIYDNGFIIIKVKNPLKKTEGGKPLDGLRIIIDAGHGGTDTGALGFLGTKGKNEKDLNLEIALALKPQLIALGADVIMIRETDEAVDIYKRMDRLNEINPDLCVSIHHNSMSDATDNSRTRGLLALYCNESGRLLAKTCSNAVSFQLNRVERNVRYQSLAMLRNHKFAAALIEMLFISNPDEYESACEPATVRRSAKALADGIINWAQGQY